MTLEILWSIIGRGYCDISAEKTQRQRTKQTHKHVLIWCCASGIKDLAALIPPPPESEERTILFAPYQLQNLTESLVRVIRIHTRRS